MLAWTSILEVENIVKLLNSGYILEVERQALLKDWMWDVRN